MLPSRRRRSPSLGRRYPWSSPGRSIRPGHRNCGHSTPSCRRRRTSTRPCSRESGNSGVDDLNAFCEFEVLAHSAGALEESDFDRLIDAIDSARPSTPRDLPLLSESADAREIINGRIAQLCDDPARWAAYRTLLESLYGTLDGWWRAEGIPTAENGVVAARRELARGGEWNRMVSADCSLVQEHFPEILQRPVPVVLAVCALFGKGMYLDLPGCQLVGVGTGMGELGARARTEELARQLRVLA